MTASHPEPRAHRRRRRGGRHWPWAGCSRPPGSRCSVFTSAAAFLRPARWRRARVCRARPADAGGERPRAAAGHHRGQRPGGRLHHRPRRRADVGGRHESRGGRLPHQAGRRRRPDRRRDRAIERSTLAHAASHERRAFLERLARLTPRERQVGALMIQGLLNKQIAGELGTAEKTVKVHRARVMEKLAVGSVAELARLAERTQTRCASSRRAGRAAARRAGASAPLRWRPKANWRSPTARPS